MARQSGTGKRGTKAAQTPEPGATSIDPPAEAQAEPAQTVDASETHARPADEPEGPPAETAPAETAPAETPEPELAPAQAVPDEARAETPKAERPQPQPRASLWPPLLGGVAAAAIGAGVALFVFPQGLFPANTDDRLGALETRLSTAISQLEAQIPADPAPALAALGARIDQAASEPRSDPAIAARLDALEAALAALSPTAIDSAVGAAIEAQLAPAIDTAVEAAIGTALGQSVAEQEDRAAEISAAQAELARTQAAIERRAALADLSGAAQSGAPAAAALARLAATGADVAALSALETGIATLAALQADFAPAARAALAAAPLPEDAAPLDRVTGFLRGVTNARSLSPREGDDTDAILSRAEAHLRAGDLNAALAELDALPEGPASAMADWRTQTQLRAQTLAALATLMEQD